MRFLLVNVNNNSRSVAINIEKTRIDSGLRFFPFLFDSIRNCIKSNRETVFFAWVCGYLFFVCLFRCFARIFWEVNSSTFHIILEICIEARNRQSVRRYTVVSQYTIAYTLTLRERQRKMEDRKRNIHAPMHIHTTAGKFTYTEQRLPILGSTLWRLFCQTWFHFIEIIAQCSCVCETTARNLLSAANFVELSNVIRFLIAPLSALT